MVFVGLVAGAVWLPAGTRPDGPRDVVPREVVIVARNMSFYNEDGTRSNPTVRVKVGERVRITLVNEDAGFDHDLAIPAWSVGTPISRGVGRTSAVFQAPDKPGRTDYVCSKHVSMMAGQIEVSR